MKYQRRGVYQCGKLDRQVNMCAVRELDQVAGVARVTSTNCCSTLNPYCRLDSICHYPKYFHFGEWSLV